jgi:glutamate 5-kinase
LSYSDFERNSQGQYREHHKRINRKKQLHPIINENDGGNGRNQFGDNDKLAALTAVLLKVDILIIAIPWYLRNHSHEIPNHFIGNRFAINATRSGDSKSSQGGRSHRKLSANINLGCQWTERRY